MRSLRDLERSTLEDAGVAALALAVQFPITMAKPDAWPDPGFLGPVLSVASALALLARRRHPVAVTLLLALGTVASPVLMVPLAVALYSAGAYAPRSAAMSAYGTVAIGTAALQVLDDGLDGLVRGPVIALALHFPVGVGVAVAARRQEMADLVDRVERAEREKQLLADAAVAAERARLAREMHDVVAHRVSLMVLHSSALELAPAVSGEAALIGTIGRQALDELRQMLDVLRDGAEAPPLAPLPGVAELDDLAAASRATGLAVTLRRDGDLSGLPGPVSRTAFRVVQEALTNAHKHAPGAAVDVWLRRAEAFLDVHVVNRPPGADPLDVPGGGHGLAGVRERVALVGGRVSVGPTGEGGWAVRAELPAP